jgi:hypothetical protein
MDGIFNMHGRNNQFTDDFDWNRLFGVLQQKSKDNIEMNRGKACEHVKWISLAQEHVE